METIKMKKFFTPVAAALVAATAMLALVENSSAAPTVRNFNNRNRRQTHKRTASRLNFVPTTTAVMQAATMLKEANGDLNKIAGDDKLKVAVIMGMWKDVKKIVDAKDAKTAMRLADKIVAGQLKAKTQSQLTKDDIWTIISLYRTNPGTSRAEKIGRLLTTIATFTDQRDMIVKELQDGFGFFGGKTDQPARDNAASLLNAAGLPAEGAKYIIPLEKAMEQKKFRIVEIHKDNLARQYAKDKLIATRAKLWMVLGWLSNQRGYGKAEEAFNASFQIALNAPRYAAIDWIVSLIKDNPEKQLSLILKGAKWIDKANSGRISFRPESVYDGDKNKTTQSFVFELRKQKLIAESLIAYGETLTGKKRQKFNDRITIGMRIMAQGWSRQASHSIYAFIEAARRMRDRNLRYRNISGITPIPVKDLLATCPSQKWQSFLSSTMANQFLTTMTEIQTMSPDSSLNSLRRNIILITKGDSKRGLSPQPKRGAELINRYLALWTKKNNPNYYPKNQMPGRRMKPLAHRVNVPTTRAKQIRALDHLAELVSTLKEQGIYADIDKKILVRCFMQSHSSTEVYRTNDLVRVFCGSDSLGLTEEKQLAKLSELDPDLLATIAAAMRARLGKHWKSMKLQRKKSTNRTVQEVQGEVLRGYRLAVAMLSQALQKKSNPKIRTLFGSILFAQAEYQYSLSYTTLEQYTESRERAFEMFKSAALEYAAQASTLKPAEQTVNYYLNWFDVIMGASDLSYSKPVKNPALASKESRIYEIRQALIQLQLDNKGEADSKVAMWHYRTFADTLTKSIVKAGEHLKYFHTENALIILAPITEVDFQIVRDLNAGKKAVADAKAKLAAATKAKDTAAVQAAQAELKTAKAKFAQAQLAKTNRAKALVKNVRFGKYTAPKGEKVVLSTDTKVLEERMTYYSELMSELKLVARIDGGSNVAKGRQMGIILSLVHTSDLARTSGKFRRLLENADTDAKGAAAYTQQTGMEANLNDYREEFGKHITEALSESFDIDEVRYETTFQCTTKYRYPDKDVERIGGSWNEMPLAYIVVTPKTDVSRIPPVQIDVDFKDRFGMVMLPVRSAEIIFKQVENFKPAKLSGIEVIQTLDPKDTSDSDDGKVSLTITVRGNGMMPDVKDIVDLKFPGYSIENPDAAEILKLETMGLKHADELVVNGKKIPAGQEFYVRTSRQVTYDLKPNDVLKKQPTFTFASLHSGIEGKMYNKLMKNSNLERLEPGVKTITLSDVTKKSGVIFYIISGVVGIIIIGLVIGLLVRSKSSDEQVETIHSYYMPESATPFRVLCLLRAIAEDTTLDFQDAKRTELQRDILTLERCYFSDQTGNTDVAAIASRWVEATR